VAKKFIVYGSFDKRPKLAVRIIISPLWPGTDVDSPGTVAVPVGLEESHPYE